MADALERGPRGRGGEAAEPLDPSAPGATARRDARAAPSFAAIVSEHTRRVWRTLRRLGVREADVEDVCQEVFVVVHRKLLEFRGDSSIETWLYGICMRAASDHRRRAHVRREQLTEVMPEVPVAAPQEGAAEQREALRTLDRVLSHLDDDKRVVFVLFELEELSMRDVAEVAGCPVQTAYCRLYAARRAIEAAMNDHRGGSE